MISVVGLGTVGLPIAATLARRWSVVGVDVSAARRREILDPDAPLAEPGLREAVNAALSAGRLRLAPAPEAADAHLVCVPTSLTATTPPSADLGPLHAAIDALAPVLRAGDLVAVESTAPPDALPALARRAGVHGVHWAVAPERLLPGRALVELSTVPRVVGGLTHEATARVAAFYREHFEVEVHGTDAVTAAVTKLAENAARDVQIALANELTALASAAGADPAAVLRLAATHPRVDLLRPGIGVGGHCLPVAPWFLVAADPTAAHLLPAARRANDAATDRALAAIRTAADAIGPSPRIALLGAAYKPGSADVRDSPALAIARALHAEGRRIVVADPVAAGPGAPGVAPRGLAELPWSTAEEALATADLAVLLVAHPELVTLARGRLVLDLCGGLS